MSTDPIARLTAADTLLITVVSQRTAIPAEIAPIIPPPVYPPASRCLSKPSGQLLFTLSSAKDLGFPASLDFDITFVGTVLPPVPPAHAPGVRWDVNQVVQATFPQQGGPAVRIETVTGGVFSSGVVDTPPTAGTSCAGQPRTFDAQVAWLGGARPDTELDVLMVINGQQRTLKLRIMYFWAQCGEAEQPQLHVDYLIGLPLWLRAMWYVLHPEDPLWGQMRSARFHTPTPTTQVANDLIVGAALLDSSAEVHDDLSREEVQRVILKFVNRSINGVLNERAKPDDRDEV